MMIVGDGKREIKKRLIEQRTYHTVFLAVLVLIKSFQNTCSQDTANMLQKTFRLCTEIIVDLVQMEECFSKTILLEKIDND